MIKQGQLRIKLFVEGDTEKNYFTDLRKANNVKLVYKPVNMKGGGYGNFLKELKKSSDTGFIATFILVDLDRLIKIHGEREHFNKLLEYCQNKNKNGRAPYFLIATNKDFEYFACTHCTNYKETDTKTYIEKNFNRKIDELKADKKIYEFLNQKQRSFKTAINKIKKNNANPKRKPYISNDYEFNQKTLDIKIKIFDTSRNEEALQYNHSNIEELFDVIGVEI